MISRRRTTTSTVTEIHTEHEAVADAITAALGSNESRRKVVVDALTADTDLAAGCPVLASVAREADALTEQLEERVKTLRGSSTDETKKHMTAKVQELRARKLLGQHEQLVLNEIERKKKFAAYGLCIDDTKTQAITQKSTAVTRTAVTQKLKQSFQDELVNLAFRHVEVELKEVGGAEGDAAQRPHATCNRS